MSLSEPFYLDKSDLGSWKALNAFSLKVKEAEETNQRLAVLGTWRETTLFSDLESAALSVAEATTTLPESETRIAELAASRLVLNDARFSAIQWESIAMSAFNRVSILSQHPVRLSAK